MTTKNISEDSPKRSKRRAPKPKTTKLGRSLITGAKEILAHVRGEIELPHYTLPGPVDVKAIRERLSLTQTEFARAYWFSPRTLQEWEQGRTQPDSAVRAYLTVIDRNPQAVKDALL